MEKKKRNKLIKPCDLVVGRGARSRSNRAWHVAIVVTSPGHGVRVSYGSCRRGLWRSTRQMTATRHSPFAAAAAASWNRVTLPPDRSLPRGVDGRDGRSFVRTDRLDQDGLRRDGRLGTSFAADALLYLRGEGSTRRGRNDGYCIRRTSDRPPPIPPRRSSAADSSRKWIRLRILINELRRTGV